MLQKFTFYDDPLSEMETLDSVDSMGFDDDFVEDPAVADDVSHDVTPKKSTKSSNRGTGKKRTRQPSRAA